MKQLTKIQINSIVKKHRALEKQMCNIAKQMDKLQDVLINHQEHFDALHDRLTRGTEWHIKRNKKEAKKILTYLDRLDSAEFKMFNR